VVPNAFEDLRARQQLARILGKIPEQAKFERRETDVARAVLERVKIPYEFRRAGLEAAVAVAAARTLAAAQERLDPRDELVARKRLAHVVVGAEAETFEHVVL